MMRPWNRFTTIPLRSSPEQLLKACAIHRGRAGGPGGQHRNKVETAIHIVHEPTGIDGQASERRSQTDNHRVALFRLRVKLAVEHREFLPKFAQPSALWQSRCRGRQDRYQSHASGFSGSVGGGDGFRRRLPIRCEAGRGPA
jgi:hypothetical protein